MSLGNDFACTGGRLLRTSRPDCPRGRSCQSRVKGPLGHCANLVTLKLFGSRTSIRGDPRRAFSPGLGPKSVGCGSLGKSKGVSDGSVARVNSPAIPRVMCNFKNSVRCGGFSFSIFFRKITGADLVVRGVRPFASSRAALLSFVTGSC